MHPGPFVWSGCATNQNDEGPKAAMRANAQRLRET